MTRIGFVGLGQMGRAMAPHLAGDGRQVTGHDLVRPDPLPANIGFSARLEDLAASDLIITMLPDGAAVRAVVERLLDRGVAETGASGAPNRQKQPGQCCATGCQPPALPEGDAEA